MDDFVCVGHSVTSRMHFMQRASARLGMNGKLSHGDSESLHKKLGTDNKSINVSLSLTTLDP